MKERMFLEFDKAFSSYAKIYVDLSSKGQCYKIYPMAHELLGMVYLMLQCDFIDHDFCGSLIACINLEEVRYVKPMEVISE